MQQHLIRNKKVDAPHGIRNTVWLVVFGLVLVCVLIISRHYIAPGREIAAEEVREQDSSPHSSPMVRRTAQTEVRPKAYEERGGYGNGETELSMVEQIVQDRRTWVDDPQW